MEIVIHSIINLILKKMKTEQQKCFEVIARHYNKIGYYNITDTPQTIKNGWLGDIENVICYIDYLNLTTGIEDLIQDLKNRDLKFKKIGLDIYVISNNN